ncbi:MAG: type III pantothenate kinase [Bacteroidota bacterium]
MDLTIDIGNSNVKLGLFKSGSLISTHKLNTINHQKILQYALKRNVKNVIISSVKSSTPFYTPRLKKYFRNFIELSINTPLPIKIRYKSPESLGRDRIAAAVGANHLFPGKNVLVIDMGSAITFDIITKNKEFIGGNISPGMNMRFLALNQFTNQLPLYHQTGQYNFIGQDTREAIISGVQTGIIFEIERYIEYIRGIYAPSETIITGGDCKFFDNKLKYHIFAEPNLVNLGLYKILKNNLYE